MNQELEIEFKNIITKEEFQLLCAHFSIQDEHFKHQENHYFDTPDFSLKNNNCALRIRRKKDSYEMTLKQPAKEGLLETNETLSSEIAQAMILHNKIAVGTITDILKTEFNIVHSQLEYFGSLSTSRAETTYLDGLLVLDHSTYLNKEDFELEYEVTDFASGKENFYNLLKKLNIPIRHTDNKIKRFYNAKFNL